MPRPSVLFIRAAWIWFLIGLGLGGVMTVERIFNLPGIFYTRFTLHVHILLIGFVTQWIMGIAYWIYPRNFRQPAEIKQGLERLALFCWYTLNIGIVLRSVGEFNLKWFYVVGIKLQLLAGICFVVVVWKRIKPSERLTKKEFAQAKNSQ